MPGYDRTQDQVISARNLETMLQGFAQDNAQVKQSMIELLALLREKNSKRPSIFKGGGNSDIIQTYDLPQGGNAFFNFQQTGVTTVGVISIEDADLVRATVKFPLIVQEGAGPPALVPTPPLMAFALSPWDGKTPIRPEQFSFLLNSNLSQYGTSDPLSNENAAVSIASLWDEIPTAGNKYLHFLGSYYVNDLIQSLLTLGSGYFFSYALIK